METDTVIPNVYIVHCTTISDFHSFGIDWHHQCFVICPCINCCIGVCNCIWLVDHIWPFVCDTHKKTCQPHQPNWISCRICWTWICGMWQLFGNIYYSPDHFGEHNFHVWLCCKSLASKYFPRHKVTFKDVPLLQLYSMDISPNYAGTINGVSNGISFFAGVLTSEMLGYGIVGNVCATINKYCCVIFYLILESWNFSGDFWTVEKHKPCDWFSHGFRDLLFWILCRFRGRAMEFSI